MNDIVRQAFAQVCDGDAGKTAGRHIAKGLGGALCKQVAHPLRRRFETAAAQYIGGLFQAPLKRNTGQRMSVAEIGRTDADQETAVRVDAVPSVAAHTVGYHAFHFVCRCNNGSTGTHAEGIDAASVLAMMGGAIFRCAQTGMAGKGAELRLVNHCLGMLDARTNGKRFLGHGYAGLMQHLEGVTGAVAKRQHRIVRAYFLVAVDNKPAQYAILDVQARYPGVKAYITAQFNDGVSNMRHHGNEFVRTDMRTIAVLNLRRRARFDKLPDNPGMAMFAVFDLGAQFTV